MKLLFFLYHKKIIGLAIKDITIFSQGLLIIMRLTGDISIFYVFLAL
jgi:hypothetical protein